MGVGVVSRSASSSIVTLASAASDSTYAYATSTVSPVTVSASASYTIMQGTADTFPAVANLIAREKLFIPATELNPFTSEAFNLAAMKELTRLQAVSKITALILDLLYALQVQFRAMQ